MRRRGTGSIGLRALVAAALAASPAIAAICGDANGDGQVTVSDGVQALRAAAGLSSSCDQNCDVDGSGAVTVSDGVNILRKAAGLAITEQCPDVAGTLIGHTIDIFGPLTKSGATAAAAPCDNPEGSVQQTAGGIVYDDCDFGDVNFSGFLGRSDNQLVFDALTIRRRGDVVSFAGSLFVGQIDGDAALSGVLDGDSQLLGSYVVTFQQAVIDEQGGTLDGELVFDTTGANLPRVVEVRVTLAGGTALPVVVRFDDDTTADFTYDPTTDVLMPADTPAPPAARVRLSNIDDRITAFLNGAQVLQAQASGPNATADTGFQPVAGLRCGDNVFEFRVENTVPGSGYTFRTQLEVGSMTIVDRTCGQVGVQNCDGNDQTQGEVVRDVTFVCVPCGPCMAGAGTCAVPLVIPPTGRIQIHGRVAGTNRLGGPCGGGGGPESVFVFTPQTTGCYEFNSCGTAFDSQLSLGDGFCGTNGPIQENCLDGNQSCVAGGAHESTFGFFSAGQPITLLLDSEGSQGGSYVFDVRPSGQCIL
ncbi:MAG: dockerin type I repeat-containing protein [Deltaproteobacteria bacterium]|nr:dockerin type I repeat-containing protein [Deltaproteobacteria bacterium]